MAIDPLSLALAGLQLGSGIYGMQRRRNDRSGQNRIRNLLRQAQASNAADAQQLAASGEGINPALAQRAALNYLQQANEQATQSALNQEAAMAERDRERTDRLTGGMLGALGAFGSQILAARSKPTDDSDADTGKPGSKPGGVGSQRQAVQSGKPGQAQTSSRSRTAADAVAGAAGAADAGAAEAEGNLMERFLAGELSADEMGQLENQYSALEAADKANRVAIDDDIASGFTENPDLFPASREGTTQEALRGLPTMREQDVAQNEVFGELSRLEEEARFGGGDQFDAPSVFSGDYNLTDEQRLARGRALNDAPEQALPAIAPAADDGKPDSRITGPTAPDLASADPNAALPKHLQSLGEPPAPDPSVLMLGKRRGLVFEDDPAAPTAPAPAPVDSAAEARNLRLAGDQAQRRAQRMRDRSSGESAIIPETPPPTRRSVRRTPPTTPGSPSLAGEGTELNAAWEEAIAGADNFRAWNRESIAEEQRLRDEARDYIRSLRADPNIPGDAERLRRQRARLEQLEEERRRIADREYQAERNRRTMPAFRASQGSPQFRSLVQRMGSNGAHAALQQIATDPSSAARYGLDLSTDGFLREAVAIMRQFGPSGVSP